MPVWVKWLIPSRWAGFSDSHGVEGFKGNNQYLEVDLEANWQIVHLIEQWCNMGLSRVPKNCLCCCVLHQLKLLDTLEGQPCRAHCREDNARSLTRSHCHCSNKVISAVWPLPWVRPKIIWDRPMVGWNLSGLEPGEFCCQPWDDLKQLRQGGCHVTRRLVHLATTPTDLMRPASETWSHSQRLVDQSPENQELHSTIWAI